MSISASWDAAVASAKKILGKDAKIPDFPSTMGKGTAELEKAWSALDKSREDLEKKILALQNANDSIKNGLKQFSAKIEKSDFDLDSKDKDNAKKISDAQKILTDALDKGMTSRGKDDKMLDELDKHVIQLSKYNLEPSKS